MAAQLFFDTTTDDTYMFVDGKWQPVTPIATKKFVFAGTYNAKTSTVDSATDAGGKLGFFPDKNLPPCFPVNHGYYVVVMEEGRPNYPAPSYLVSPPDYLLSTADGWKKTTFIV